MVPGGPQDRESVADFIDQLYRATNHHLDRTALLGRADDMLAAGPVFFLEGDGARIGYAALRDMGDHMFVRHFVIDKAMRGKGVGAQAFKALQAAQFPGRQARLDASHTVTGPREFWEAQGFKIMGYTMRLDSEDAA